MGGGGSKSKNSFARAGGGGGAGAGAKEKSFLLWEKMVFGHTMIRRKSQERSGCFLNIAPKL